MANAIGRVGGWWKAAAGCAICASLVAGLIQDARYWVWDRTVGFVFPAQATFDTCLSRQMDALKRPEGALYQVIVTVPLGDRDQTAFRQIETSLTRAYGETEGAAIRVGALDCEALKPTAGDSAARVATAEARADALLAGTGADAVLWGEVFGDGKTMELRFAHPRDPGTEVGTDKAAVYQAGAITLDLSFGKDIGALIAARALDRAIEIGSSDRLDQGEVAAHILALLGPLVTARPSGISDENYAEILMSEAHAACTAAAAAADGHALLAAADRLGTAADLFPPEAEAKRDFARILAAHHRASTASLLPAVEARAAMIQAVAEFDALGPRVVALFGPQLDQYLQAELGLTITQAAVMMPEPERTRMMHEGIARLRHAAAALPEAAVLLDLATGLLSAIALSDDTAAVALNVEATAAIDDAMAALPEGDRGVTWLRIATLKGLLLFNSLQDGDVADVTGTLDQAIAVLSEAASVAGGTAAAVDRARVEATLGWALVGRAMQSDDAADMNDLLGRADTNLRAALAVYGPDGSPLLLGWVQSGLAFASAACADAPGCSDPDAKRADAAARFADAAESFRIGGNDEKVARMLALSEKYGSAP